MGIQVDRLRVLVEIARTGSLAGAANALGVGPSAVSQQISTFERELQAELLIRTTKPATLTRLGRDLAAHGESILAELERAEITAQDASAKADGDYTIAALPSVAVTMLAETVADLRVRAPGLRVLVRDLDTTESLTSLATQEVDLAIIDNHPLDPVVVPASMTVTDLGREPFQVLSGQASAGGAAPVELSTFAEHPWVLPSSATAGGRAAGQLIRRAGFEPDVRLETHDLHLLRTFVARGVGVTLLPRLALTEPPAGCNAVDVADIGAHRTLHAVTRSSTGGRIADAQVLQAIEQVARRHLDALP